MIEDWQRDLLIFTVYFLSVAYVFSKIAADLNNFVSLKFDEQEFDSQLELQGLQDIIDINVKFKGYYRPNDIKELAVTVENKAEAKTLYINWEQCTLTDFSGQSRRIIRLVPGMDLDLAQPQVFGVAAPKQSLTEKIVAEDSLKRNEVGILDITKPLFNPDKLITAAEKQSRFTLRLVVEVSEPSVGIRGGSLHALNCNVFVTKTPWRRTVLW